MMAAILSGLINGAALGLLLTSGVWLLLRAIPRRMLNASTRYCVWWLALAAAIVLLVPEMPPVPANARPARGTGVVNEHHKDLSPPFRAPHQIARPAKPVSADPFLIPSHPARPEIVPGSPEPKPPSIHFPVAIPAAAWLAWVILIWPLVSVFLLARLAASLIELNRLKARAEPLTGTPGMRVGTWLAQCGGERKGIRIAASSEIATPVATGPRNPTILIPERLVGRLSEDDFDRIGLHETAHLVRRDDYALILQRVLQALFVFSPAVHWIARSIDLEREIACDDLVIAATGAARSYAACLTRIVEVSAGMTSPWPAATAAEDTSHLTRRIDALLAKTKRGRAGVMKSRLATAFAILPAMVFAAGRLPALVAFIRPAASFAPASAHRPTAQRASRGAQILPMAAQASVLQGQVLEDSSGNPLPSAELRFRQAGMRELAADLATDREGRFSAESLPPGDYSVEVDKPNYAPTDFRLHVPSPALAVRLVRYGVIDGQATNASGQPLPGRIVGPTGRTVGSARVTILAKDAMSGAMRSFREIALADGGRYRIYDLPPGQYTAAFWYAGLNEGAGMQFYPDNANPRVFTVSGGEEYDNVDFIAIPGPLAQVSGKLAIPEGAKGQFQLALGLPDQPLLPIAQTLSEPDGSFRFEKVPAGSYDLLAAGPTGGYTAFASTLARGEPLFGRIRVQVSGQNIDNLSVPLDAGKSVSVLLRAAGGGPQPEGCPASASLQVTALEPWAVIFTTGAQAAFAKEQTIAGLAPGRFRIAASDIGQTCFQPAETVVDLSAGAAAPAVIELAAAGSVRGSVKTSGAVVVLMNAHATDGAQSRVAYPDSTGHFLFDALPPARYRIAAYPAGAARTRWISERPRGLEIDVTGGTATHIEALAVLSGEGPQQ